MTWYAARVELEHELYLLPNRRRGSRSQDPRTGRLLPLDASAPVDPWTPLQRPHRLVQQVLARAGYPVTQEGGHTMRRSAARAYFDELCEQGYDGALRRVQSMLDHSNSIVTESYLGLGLDKQARNLALRGRSMFARHEVPDTAVVPFPVSRTHGTT